ncbi:hypothetical protein RMT25_06380 [Oenococcus oeni]|uniref:hypothetical protein n=1 Tax=Oenococcus oeni TaxID=1247 RepID=UPI002934DEA7|nr:hypothetical protein [Oenococcus oeni]WOC53496.1 hypothetical protein RMT25_06380 [Oenococcus oeni]
MRWTKDILEKAKSLKNQDLSYPKIAKKLNKEFDISVSASSVNHALLDYQRGKYHFTDKKNSKDRELKNKIRINEDGSEESTTLIKMTEEQAKSKEFVLKAHGFNPSEWSIVNVVNNLWQQHSIQDGTVYLYQSKIIVKPKTGLTLEEQLAFLTENIKPVQMTDTKQSLSTGNLVIPLADMHWGIMTFNDYLPILKRLIEIIQQGYNRIVIEQLGDYYHSDQINSSQTVKATHLNEVDMPKAIHDGEKFMFTLIETAYQYCNHLSVKYVGGNHSYDLEYMFEELLRLKYPQVDVDINNGYRDAYLLDRVGIIISHGDKALNKIPMLFASEFSDIWAKANYRESHNGHYHFSKDIDSNGVVNRQIPVLKKGDSYEYENGLTMSAKRMEAFEYYPDGPKAIYYI